MRLVAPSNKLALLLGAATCAALAGCPQPEDEAGAPGATGRPRSAGRYTEAEAVPESGRWLSPLADAQSSVRAHTPAGVELRQAVFSADGLVLLLRDYEVRDAAKPDRQWLVETAVKDGEAAASRLELPQSALPSRLLPAGDRKQFAVVGWLPVKAEVLEAAEETTPAQGEGAAPPAEAEPPAPASVPDSGYDLGSPHCWVVAPPGARPAVAEEPDTQTAEPAVETTPPAPAARFELAPVQAHMPVLFGGDGALYFRPLGRVSVKGGLIDARVDWTGQPSVWKPGGAGDVQAMDDPALIVAPGNALAAGLRPAATVDAAAPDAQPAWELYLWRSGRGLQSRLLLTLPVAGDVLPDDAAALAWLDAGQLGVVCPQPAGGDRLNWQLLSVDTSKAESRLVADHLPGRTAVVAMDGCLFYCRPAGDGSWELWAASADGRTKRLLFSAAETVSLSLADARGGRLLVNRQYFGEGGGTLHNALIELGLGPQPKWWLAQELLSSPNRNPGIELGGAAPARPRRATGSPDEGFFIPDSPGGANPSDRYRRRGDGGNDTGGGNESGGGGGNEPDLSLPGL